MTTTTTRQTSGHAAHPTRRLMGAHLQYRTKNWSDAFECPVCGLRRRFSLNFLGNRRVPMCDGKKITAGPVLSFDDYRSAVEAAKAVV